jgi:hypothetical protein
MRANWNLGFPARLSLPAIFSREFLFEASQHKGRDNERRDWRELEDVYNTIKGITQDFMSRIGRMIFQRSSGKLLA